jgi:Asp-tRNA(Asn)/Glu-tRNA(Gln) amidotransferase A subunit family amidase
VPEISRIGISLSHCSEAVRRVLEDAVEALPVTVVDVALPDVRAATFTIMLAEAANLWWHERGGLSQETVALLESGRSADLADARAQVLAARDEVDSLLGSVDAILLPTVPVPAAPFGTAGLASTYFRFAALASATGHPALTVPAGLAAGLPVGAQLIGPRYGESLLCALGTMIESAPAGVGLAEARADLVYQMSPPR